MPDAGPLCAEVLSQGDEIVTGQTADTNAAWLSGRLTDLGFVVTRHTAVADDARTIAAVVDEAAGRAAFVVSTGGLGPTDDDLTALAVSRATDRPLVPDAEALAAIERFFQEIGRPMARTNRKQALLPAGARRLDNGRGTAPGFALEHRRALLAFLPGVPREMRWMFEHQLVPLLEERFPLTPRRLITLRCAGIGESDLQARIGSAGIAGVQVGFRTLLPENHVKLRIDPDVPDEEVRRLVGDLRRRIGASVFTVEGLGGAPGGSLAEVTGRLLVSAGATLALEEGASGGLVAASLARQPAAARFVSEARVRFASWQAGDDAPGRACGLARAAGTDWALVSLPERPPEGKGTAMPVAETAIAVSGPGMKASRALRLPGDAERRQRLAAGAALDLLRRALAGLSGEPTGAPPDRA